MKICLIVDDYLPGSIKVAAKMMHELAVELLNQGHEVMVITPGVGINSSSEKLVIDGVSVYRFKTGPIKNISKIKRAINESLLSWNAWSKLKYIFKNKKCDLIVYYSPSIFWGPLVLKLKKLWNAKAYLILRDIFPQWAIDNGFLDEGSLITKYFRYFEKLNYDAAEKIGVQSANNVTWFNEKFNIYKNIELLHNWASDDPVKPENVYRKKLGLENKIVFFYGGNIGHAQDMGNVLRLAKNLQEKKEVFFVLVGAGDEVGLVKEFIIKEKLVNMILLDPVSQEEFKKMLSEFDIGLFSLHHDHQTHNFPGKVLGYLVQGMPVLGCVNPGNDMKEVIENAGAGYVSIAGDDDSLHQNAIKLLNENTRKKNGIKAKKLLKDNFSVHAAAKNILNSYKK